MDPDRHRQVEELFYAALEREPAERESFLAAACGSDSSLRAEVCSLLEAHEQPGSFIDAPAYQVAAELLAGDSTEPRPGQVIGHYQIRSLLGRGGMGEVYLAEDTHLERQVALKLLPAEFTTDPNRVRRFAQEARAASSLNHPNIITIHEIGQVGETHYIVTEYVEGQTLRQQMTGTHLELSAVLEIGAQVASALQAAHAAGITHRDIKPENIMVRPDGYVKVLDFGLAKLKRPASASGLGAITKTASTSPGVVIGTPHYMSPEQARGLEVDARSDLFSLGVVLYEMLAGHVPFEGATTTDVFVSILEREPASLSQSSPHVSPELAAVVAKALRKIPEERYPAVKDLLLDLRRHRQRLELAAELGDALPPERRGSPTPTTGSNETPARATARGRHLSQALQRGIGLALVVVLAAAAVITYLMFSSQSPTSRPPPKPLPRPAHWWAFNWGNGAQSDSGTGPNLSQGVRGSDTQVIPGREAGTCSLSGAAASLKGARDSFFDFGSAVGQFGKRDFTVCLWFKTATTEPNSEVLSNRADTENGNFFSLRFNNDPRLQPPGKLYFELDQDGEGHNYLVLFSPTGLNDGQWHYLALRRQGVSGAMFIDGTLVTAAETANRVEDGVTKIENGKPLLLGSSPFIRESAHAPVSPFEGEIDELQLYEAALSDEEVSALYEASQDSDGDGVCDNLDECPHSERSQSVMIARCQANVPNHLLAKGCTLNDRLAGCAAAAQSHRQFVSCVSSLTGELVKAGNLSAQEQERIAQCAAAAKIP